MAERLILVMDTATRHGALGLARADGSLVASDTWATGHRHGEELLPRLDALLASAGAGPTDIAIIGVGTGPGSFTGLRVGLATAKTMAYVLGVPLTGISTAEGLALASGVQGEVGVALPAGANDRYLAHMVVSGGLVEQTSPPELVTSLNAETARSGRLVAVDLEISEVHPKAVALGNRAVENLVGALGRLVVATSKRDDVAELVPAYVALPRGIAAAAANMEWSPDLR